MGSSQVWGSWYDLEKNCWGHQLSQQETATAAEKAFKQMPDSNKSSDMADINKAVLCMGRFGELSLHINANLYVHFGSRS